MKRAAVIQSVCDGFDGEICDLSLLFRTQLEPMSPVFFGDRAKSRAPFDSEKGMQQSSGEGLLGFCLGMHADPDWADGQLSRCGGCAKADMDDIYLLGPFQTTLDAALELCRPLGCSDKDPTES